VLRLRQDVDEGVFRELVQGGHDGETTDELGDQTGADEVLRLNLREDLTDLLLLAARDLGAEAEAALADARLDDLLETDERAAADEEDVGRVDLQEVLLGVLAPALRRHVGDRALDDLEQRLLHALAADVAGDRRVVALACDLV